MLGENLMEGAWFWKAPILKRRGESGYEATAIPNTLYMLCIRFICGRA